MGSIPRSACGKWLGSCGVVAVLVTACGSAQSTPTVTARAAASPTATALAANPTLPVIPPAPPIAPLTGYAANGTGHLTLYSATGTQTGTLPASPDYQVVSPLGDRLLGELQTDAGITGLVAITATGAVSKLETITDPADFLDAIGSEDGTQWAWMMKGPAGGGCGGNPPPPIDTYVYLSSTPGQGTLIAKLPPLKPEGVGWTFYQWTAAGIVLSEGGPPGCYEGPRFNPNHTDLLNPATGVVTSLTSKLGSADCILQDIADDGTMACIPGTLVSEETHPTASSLALRIVLPDGAQRDLTAAQFIHGCTLSTVLFGDVTITRDAGFVSLSRWCQATTNGNETLIETWIIDVSTLNSVQVSIAGLGADGWLPGTSTLIATGDQIDYGTGPNPPGSYAVSADGTATELTSTDLGFQSLAHY